VLELNMERDVENPWSLTDEEWCELCFRIVELGEAQKRFEDAMLSEERPSLHQLWRVASAYQRQSDDLFSYIGQQLRQRAITGERRAA
jgi:hypothetical protein